MEGLWTGGVLVQSCQFIYVIERIGFGFVVSDTYILTVDDFCVLGT